MSKEFSGTRVLFGEKIIGLATDVGEDTLEPASIPAQLKALAHWLTVNPDTVLSAININYDTETFPDNPVYLTAYVQSFTGDKPFDTEGLYKIKRIY